MSDVVVVSNEPDPPDNTVVVVDNATPTDPLLDIVTRLTRVEDGLATVSAVVADINVRTDINEMDTRYVMQQQAATDAVVEEVVEIVSEVAEATEPTTETETPTETPTETDTPPNSKVHRFWAGKNKS